MRMTELRLHRKGVAEFLSETYKSALLTNQMHTLGLTSQLSGFNTMVMSDHDWIADNIDPDFELTKDLIARASGDIHIDLSAIKQRISTGKLSQSLNHSNGTLASWLFTQSNTTLASALCGITELEFNNIAQYVRDDIYNLPTYQSLLSVCTVEISNWLINQINNAIIELSTRFDAALFLAKNGLTVNEAINWLNLPWYAKQYIKSSTRPGKPRMSNLRNSEYLSAISAGLKLASQQTNDPAMQLVMTLKYMLYERCIDPKLCSIRLVMQAIHGKIPNTTTDPNVAKTSRQIAELYFS